MGKPYGIKLGLAWKSNNALIHGPIEIHKAWTINDDQSKNTILPTKLLETKINIGKATTSSNI